MKFRIFKHITKFVAKNDNYIEEDFPGGPHIRMRLYVRVLPFIYKKTDCTFLHNMKLRLRGKDLQKMVDLYYAGGRTDG